MKTRLILSVLLITASFCTPKHADSDIDSVPVIKTESGLIRGVRSGEVVVFKGVPFAEPPVGDLRWKEPQPKQSWPDTLECTQFGASPVQNKPEPFAMWSQEFITPAEPLSEDCLYLNIWAPAGTGKGTLPVLVWIHGGAFVSGSGACPIYDGEELAARGVVYVSINYRLGVFGFMAHPELTAESGRGSSGNYGLMDQLAALRWIRANIAAFGGDPEKVTIAGQSAGSMSVQALVATPLGKGLFRGAIGESGAMTSRPTLSLKEAEQTGVTVAGGMNLSALRTLPADSLLARGNAIPFGRFFPIVDGYVLPDDVRTIFESRKHNDVATLAGWVEGDGMLMGGGDIAPDSFRKNAATAFSKSMEEFNRLFPSGSQDETRQSASKLGRMRFAAAPDDHWLSSNTKPGYMYEFTFVPTDKPGFPNYGAFHTSEVPFALHTLSKWDRPWQQRDFDVQEYMTAYWLNFVKTGDPNGKGLPEWKTYDRNDGYLMEFGSSPVLRKGAYKKEFEFLQTRP